MFWGFGGGAPREKFLGVDGVGGVIYAVYRRRRGPKAIYKIPALGALPYNMASGVVSYFRGDV